MREDVAESRANALWRLDGVSLGEGPSARLAGLSVDIGPGVTAVLGCSGAGKSSLLNLLVGFETPDRGELVATLPVGGHPLPLYWAPQTSGLWPHLTVRRHLLKAAAEADDDVIDHLLAEFGLEHRADAFPDQLSQGERTRLALCRALASGAAVLVLDEPLASIDPSRSTRYWEAVRRRAAQAGQSIVYATHDPRMVVGEAEDVICLRDGRLIYAGDVDTLYRNAPSREAAECLGEVNWFDPGEYRAWFGNGEARACLRPEQVSAEPSDAGRLVVESSRYRGALAEVELRHEGTGERRRVYHRPAAEHLGVGQRVVLKVLALLLLFAVIGCGDGDAPALAVRGIRAWPSPPEGTSIPGPRSLAIGAADVVVALDTVGRVLVFDDAGNLLRKWSMPATARGRPEGVCALRDGRIAVCDTHYHRVLFFDMEGNIVGQFGREGKGEGEFIYPVGIVQDSRENLYVCEYGGNDRVQKFTKDGAFVLAFGRFGTGTRQFQRPSGLAWHAGRIYVADAINNRIQVFADEGAYVGVLGGDAGLSLHYPYDLALGPDGALYVVEYGAGRVSKVDTDGRLLGRFGRTGRNEGEFATPWGIAVDSKMRLRVADTGNRRIVELRL